MKPVQESIEASVAAAASKTTGAGSAVSVVGWATSSNFGMWAGIVIGLAGLVVNVYFKRRADKRAQELHQFTLSGRHKKVLEPEVSEADE